MLVAITTVKIRQGKTGEFEAVLKEVAAKSEALEPGCLSYQGFRRQEDPHTFIVVEQYRDRAALEAHGATAHFRSAMAAFPDLVDGEPDILFCDRVT